MELPAAGTGIVSLNEWILAPDGTKVLAIQGEVTFFSAEQYTGHNVQTERNANWLLRVKGDNEEIIVPGCQVRMVTMNPQEIATSREIYVAK